MLRARGARRVVGCVALLLAGGWSIVWGVYALTLAPVASGVSAMSQEALALTAEVIAEAEDPGGTTDAMRAAGARAARERAAGSTTLGRRLVGCGLALLGSGALALVVALLHLRRYRRGMLWTAAAAGLSAELAWLALIGTWVLPALARAALYVLGSALAGSGRAASGSTATEASDSADGG